MEQWDTGAAEMFRSSTDWTDHPSEDRPGKEKKGPARAPIGGPLDRAAGRCYFYRNCVIKLTTMAKALHTALTRRERQIMDILYRRGRATASEVMADLPGHPSSSTVRTQLRVLEEKGHVRHEEHGLRYVYLPEVPRHAARRSALRHLVDTFFDGSAEQVVAAVLGGEGAKLSDEELDRIAELVDKAKKEGNR
jgi:BlaI family transcriptional regulator, penicillinase repressor